MSSSCGINWYHLADSAFPTGGYAFSSGFEAAAKLDVFTNLNELREFLEANVRQWIAYEVPYLNSCFLGDCAREIQQRYHAGQLCPTLCKGSLIQGRSFLRCLETLLGREAVASCRERISTEPDRRHFILVFAWSLRDIGMDHAEARRCALYIVIRDWISAAVRLGSIGPMEGHRLQHQLLSQSDVLLEPFCDKRMHHAYRCAPILETAQAWHGNLYSRLFQN